MQDLTKLSEFDLHKKAGTNGLPDFVTLKRIRDEQRAAAELRAWLDAQEAERQAAKAARTFTSAKDLLSRLPPAPPRPELDALGLKPLDGKKLLANLERYEELLLRQKQARREALKEISDQLDVSVDSLLTAKELGTILNRGAMSAAQGDLTLRYSDATWEDNEKRVEPEYGLNLPAINRSKGGTHPRKGKPKRKR